MRRFIFLTLVFTVIFFSLTVHAQEAVTDSAASADSTQEDVLLEGILRHVYQNDPGLQASRAELKATHELYAQALAGWRPSVSAESSIYSTDLESNNFAQGTGATTKDVTVEVNQPVFRGGRTVAETDKAKNLIKAAYADYLMSEQKLIFETARAYMNVILSRRLLGLAQNNEDLLTAELKAVKERFSGGDLTKTDVSQTESRLARAQAERLSAWGDLEQSYTEFENIVGFAPSGTFYYPATDLGVSGSSPEQMMATAKEQSQMLKAAQFRHMAAQDDIDTNFRELMPQISAFASYNKQYDPQPGITAESESQTIGLRASLALYEGGSIRSRVRQSKNIAWQRFYDVKEAEQALHTDILKNWRALKTAEEEATLRAFEAKASRQALEGVRAEARLGERTVLDTLDAEQEILSAESGLVRARHAAVMASFSLAASVGVLTPEATGLGDLMYDPGDHYRRTGWKLFTTDEE